MSLYIVYRLEQGDFQEAAFVKQMQATKGLWEPSCQALLRHMRHLSFSGGKAV